MRLAIRAYQKPKHIDLTRFINKKGYLDQYMYYSHYVLKSNSFDLFKNTLINEFNQKINKLIFKIKVNEQLVHQNRLSKNEFENIKEENMGFIDMLSNGINKISEMTPSEFSHPTSLHFIIKNDVLYTLNKFIEPNLEPLHDDALEDDTKLFLTNLNNELGDKFKSLLNITEFNSDRIYIIPPNLIHSFNSAIEQHIDIIPKNGIPIDDLYLENNKYYILSTY